METTDTTTIEDGVQLAVIDRSVSRHVIYTIKHPLAGELDIYGADAEEGRKASWEDRGTIERLIDGAIAGLPTAAMYTYAHMTKGQYFFFRQAHPHWDEYLERLRQKQMIDFMNVLNTEGVKDLTTMRWFLEHKHPDFGKKAEREVDEPLQPTVNIAIGANVDAGIVQATVREIAREVFGSRRQGLAGSEDAAAASVAGESEG